MKSRVALALGTIALSALVTATAQAATPRGVNIDPGRGPGACPSGRFCLYEHLHLNEPPSPVGLVLKTDDSLSDLRNYGFNDEASSFFNNSHRVVTVYRDVHFSGGEVTVEPGDWGPLPWNDAASSVKFRS